MSDGEVDMVGTALFMSEETSVCTTATTQKVIGGQHSASHEGKPQMAWLPISTC